MSLVHTEQVLVVPTELFHRLGYFQGFSPEADRYLAELLSPKNTSYRPRGEMEEDPSFKQLIPYVIFRHRDKAGCEQLFQYTRGKGMGERRLHSKRSVGVGGHISIDDRSSADAVPYAEGMRRELDEEVVIDTPFTERCVGLINDDQTPVGQVHLGVVHLFDVEQPNVQPREAKFSTPAFDRSPNCWPIWIGSNPGRNLPAGLVWLKVLRRSTGNSSMADLPIYMDNHATTRVDPRVLDAMLPFFSQQFGNAGSTSHRYGWEAREAVDAARESIAAAIGAEPREIVFTSGATESNNLALRGVAERAKLRDANSVPHIISVATEHKAVLDPLEFLARRGCEITLLPVEPADSPRAGLISAEQVADAIRENTVLVSVMLANNEIGAIQPIAEIGAICRQRGVLFHSDATQAVGKVACRCRTVARRLDEFFGAQNLWPQRHRRPVRAPQYPGRKVGTADFRRRTRKRFPQRHRQCARHCRFCQGAGVVHQRIAARANAASRTAAPALYGNQRCPVRYCPEWPSAGPTRTSIVEQLEPEF